ncbi:hypothetical protein C8R46DRAFT_498007 [Mycena filopes]|nr:hypothetical protein C8R46DRAFT_498007 [Mycena filopes]
MNASHVEKGPLDGEEDRTGINSEDEIAAAKLWAVYVSEAEKYDKGLVESWKSDMEGMLIFAGLFSASLTAFLIESYKTLIPDSGDTTVLLLSQISQQLAAASNGTVFHLVPLAPFTPLASSLVCNTLWFISLGLSLTCALVATLLEQWARDFLHRAEMRSAPVIRARVYSYLYYGMKKFRMHTVVEIIPLLLHTSLLFFFAGLVALLLPINIFITAVVIVILTTVVLVYAVLTLLPLFYADCPYRTPLSGGCWHLRKKLQDSLQRFRPSPGKSAADKVMVDGVLRLATTPSDERSSRDAKALIWTVKSLTDDNELEPLVEAIPDVLWGTSQKRRLYEAYFRQLAEDPGSDLVRRIQDFHHNCHSGIITANVAKHRQIACNKAMWALGSLSNPGNPVRVSVPHTRALDPEVLHYECSARAIQSWSRFCAAKDLLDMSVEKLTAADLDIDSRNTATANIIVTQLAAANLDMDGIQREMDMILRCQWANSSPELGGPTTRHLVDELTDLRLRLLLTYLAEAHELNAAPYQFELTQKLLSPPGTTTPSRFSLQTLGKHLDRIVSCHEGDFQANDRISWLDKIFYKMVMYYDPDDDNLALPWGIVQYLHDRTDHWEAVFNALAFIPTRAWRLLPATIRDPPAGPLSAGDPPGPLSASLEVVWMVCWGYQVGEIENIELSTWDAILEAASHPQKLIASVTPSVVSLLKSVILRHLKADFRDPVALSSEELTSRCNHPSLPKDVAAAPGRPDMTQEQYHAALMSELHRKYAHGQLETLTEFVRHCCSHPLLFKAHETMYFLGNFTPDSSIHPIHQLGFATALKDLFAGGHDILLQDILNSWIWGVYNFGSDLYPWLDDRQAREIVQLTLTAYLNKVGRDHPLSRRISDTLVGLDKLHPATDSQAESDSNAEPIVGAS